MVSNGEPERGSVDGGTLPATNQVLDRDDPRAIRALAQQLRVDAILCTTHAGFGYPTSALSSADLMAVLVARHLSYDWANPASAANDHLIFSKGQIGRASCRERV